MKVTLRDRVEPASHESKHQAELLAHRRQGGKTLAQYVSELRRLGKLAYPDMATVAREDFLKDLFLWGQGSDTFKEQTLTQQMEAVQLAECATSRRGGIQLNRKCGLAPPLLPRHHPGRPTTWPRPPPGNPSTPPILRWVRCHFVTF